VFSGARLSGTTSALGAAAGGWRYLILVGAVIELLYILAPVSWTSRPGTVAGWLQPVADRDTGARFVTRPGFALEYVTLERGRDCRPPSAQSRQ
jgi:hypothetical protein